MPLTGDAKGRGDAGLLGGEDFLWCRDWVGGGLGDWLVRGGKGVLFSREQ